MIINCIVCDKEIKLPPSAVKKGRKCCSHSCSKRYVWNQPNYREQMSNAHKGKMPTNITQLVERIRSDEGRAYARELGKRMGGWNKRKKMPKLSGKNHYLWIINRNDIIEKRRIRGSLDLKLWRESVFERDKYTCRECGVSGVYIEPHHIVPVRSDRSKLFNTNNGITLCRPCHIKTIWRESDFAEKYSAIVEVQL